MVRSRISATVLGLLLCAASAAAQVNVTLQLPFAEMPARVAEWRENESLIRIVVQNTGREQYEGLMLSVELSKDGRRIARTRDGHPAQPRFSLSQGETRSLSWREVISEEAVEYEGSIRQQVAATGELPEGQYQLCIRILDAQLRPRSQQVCAPFTIVLPDPPQLLSPIGGTEVSPMPLLQWTPSNPPAPGLQYQVTVKVRYHGQTPAQAMASNPVRLQATVPTTSYQVPLTEQLGVDATDPNYAGHVWQVQALLNGRPYGRNRGLSQIEWFVVPAIAVDPVKPSDGRPIAVVEWEVPYEEIRPGHPISLQVPPIQEDTVLYVLRVRVPEKLSLQQLEQLRKNWAHEVRKEISTMRERRDVPLESVRTSSSIDRDVSGSSSNHVVNSTSELGKVREIIAGNRYVLLRDAGGMGSLSNRMVDSTRKPRGVPYILVDHGKIDLRTHQDTFVVQSYPPKYATIYRVGQDTFGVQYWPPKEAVAYYLDGTPQDTAGAGKEISTMRRARGKELDAKAKEYDVVHSRMLRTYQDTLGVKSYPQKYEVIDDHIRPSLDISLSKLRDKSFREYSRSIYGTSEKSHYGVRDTLREHYITHVLEHYGRRDPVIHGQDTAGAGVDRTRYTGGYFLYALPQDTTKPAELVDYYVPNGTPQDTTEPASAARIYSLSSEDMIIVEPADRQIAYNAGVEGAIIVERRGNVLVVGNFTPTHVALPMPELELDPGDGPVCGIPGPLGQGEETVGSTARYTGYVLNQAIATGPKPSGKTLGAVTRQAPPQGGNARQDGAIGEIEISFKVDLRRMAGPISLPRPSDVGLPEFRMRPPGGGAPVLWPNGNPPSDPDWPWVGVIGTPVLEGIDGAPGPGKPQNWCGTEYIWTGPPPKSPKELILTPVIPRPR